MVAITVILTFIIDICEIDLYTGCHFNLHGEQAQVGEHKSLGFQNNQSITSYLLQSCKKLLDILYKPKLRLLT